MLDRLQSFLSSHSIKTAPMTTLGRAAQLSGDILTRRQERVIEVPLGSSSYKFMTYPGSGRTGSRGITLLRQFYEPLLARAETLVQPGDLVIDGGANSGIFTCAFAQLGANVHAFEPLPHVREHLARNVALNGLSHRVQIVPAALGDQAGHATMDLGRGAVAASIVHKRGGEEVQVIVRTLDDYMREAELSRVAFMKLDIEGAETAALLGAKDLIARDRPGLCLEVWQKDELRDLTDMLSPLGYRFAELTFDGEAPLPAPFRPIANLLALPDNGNQ